MTMAQSNVGGEINGGCPVLTSQRHDFMNHLSPVWTEQRGIQKQQYKHNYPLKQQIVKHARTLAAGPK